MFIDIHTHFKIDIGNLSIYNNRFIFDEDIKTDSFFSVGIHPWDANLATSSTYLELEKYISHPNCLAIGECGLDKIIAVDFETQKKNFEMQLQLAEKYSKPVIIHCVKAFDEVMAICNPYLNKIPLIIHGFNKSDELANQLINKGFYLSVSNSFIDKSSLENLNINKVFFETDSNDKIIIKEVYELAAEKWNINISILKEKIYRNFTTIFNT